MNLTPLSVVVDEVWGAKGTPGRDAMEAQLKEDLQAYYIGGYQGGKAQTAPHAGGIRSQSRCKEVANIQA